MPRPLVNRSPVVKHREIVVLVQLAVGVRRAHARARARVGAYPVRVDGSARGGFGVRQPRCERVRFALGAGVGLRVRGCVGCCVVAVGAGQVRCEGAEVGRVGWDAG